MTDSGNVSSSVLPGAKDFSAYLEKMTGGFTISKPKGFKSMGRGARRWTIIVDSKPIGQYTLYNALPGKKGQIRKYWGQIPGYEGIKCERQSDEKNVGLVYADKLTDDGRARPIVGPVDEDGFGRVDGHTEIPFP